MKRAHSETHSITKRAPRGFLVRIALLILQLLLLAEFLSGCGSGGIKGKVERGIAKNLPNLIGPAKSYDVKVTGSTMQILRHRIRGIDIKGQDVKLPNGLQLAQLDVSLSQVEFDTDKQAISKCAGTTYSATLAEKELEAYLRRVYPDIPELTVSLEDGYVSATARPALAGLSAAIRADAALQVRESRSLALDLRRVTVAGLPAPAFAREYVEKKINPAFDASQIGYDAKIDSVSVRKGFVTLNGTLDLTKKR